MRDVCVVHAYTAYLCMIRLSDFVGLPCRAQCSLRVSCSCRLFRSSSRLRTRKMPLPWFRPVGLQIHISPSADREQPLVRWPPDRQHTCAPRAQQLRCGTESVISPTALPRSCYPEAVDVAVCFYVTFIHKTIIPARAVLRQNAGCSARIQNASWHLQHTLRNGMPASPVMILAGIGKFAVSAVWLTATHLWRCQWRRCVADDGSPLKVSMKTVCGWRRLTFDGVDEDGPL